MKPKGTSRILVATLSASLAFLMAACGANSDNAASDKGSEANPIKIGVVGASDPQWPLFKEAAKKAGIYVELVNFTSYPELNPALTNKQLDLNQFQHLKYLAAYNVNSDASLVPIGDTAIFPIGVYSHKYKNVKDIPAGSQVTIPNDPTNQARALSLLQDAGILKLKADAPAIPAPADVDTQNSRVAVVPVDANNVVTAIDSVAATVVNNDYLKDAGLKATDAIYRENGDSKGAEPYINIWAARKEDKNNKTYLKIVEIDKQKKILDAIQTAADGSAVFTNKSTADLERILKDQEALVSKK